MTYVTKYTMQCQDNDSEEIVELTIFELQEKIDDYFEFIRTSKDLLKKKIAKREYKELAKKYNIKVGFEAYKVQI